MSSLGISILIFAAAAILAVVGVNLLQALGRRRRLSAARPKSEGEADTRSPGGRPEPDATGARPASVPGRVSRREPRLGDVAVPEGADPAFEPAGEPDAGDFGAAGSLEAAAPGDDRPSGLPESASAGERGAGHPAAPAGGPVLSPTCDCIVALPLDAPVSGERLVAVTQGVRRAGSKPILADGVPAGAFGEDAAAPLAAGVAYRVLRVGVLLANRHGPLNAMEYTEFVAAVQAVADQLSTLADTPDMADVIARARDLDATCAQLDAQIGLNVDSPEPLGPAQVAALAAELDLVDRGGHRHARLGPGGELVFTMSLTDSPQRLGFLLDVPRTAESLEGWIAMLDCAQAAASRLSGRVVDDAGKAIPLDALDTISRQLTQRYASLDAIGLPAGSPLALRVFN